ncbi:MAG: flagellar hook capping FlgD N-terminal domain-containing protein [Pseudobdellovibrionaceae bacterium]|nr:flagellar hook capping FlgD N-terminal domain-containing protein [Pseudobdellovibrionaceae bacterium]
MASISQISNATDLSTLTGTKVTTTASSSSTATDNAAAEAEKLRTQFLSILLTQMQHQNPLDPMDTKEFTGQLAQFSSLEQQINTNVKLDSLLGSLQQTAVASSFGYIGQYVDLDTNVGTLQNGQATWTYALPEDAEDVTITIKDGSGNLVYSGTLQNSSGSTEVGAGTYNFTLNPEDYGGSLAEGTVLKFSIAAKDRDGDKITADIHTTVRVDSIQSSNNNTYLQAGGLLFEISDIQKIVQPTTTQTTDTNTDTNTETSSDTTTEEEPSV